MRSFLLIVLLSLLAACTHYREPLGGSTAKLRIVSLPGNSTEVHTLDSSTCIGKSEQLVAKMGLDVKDGFHQGRTLDMPLAEGLPRTAMAEIRISAQEPMAFQIKANAAKGPRGAGWSYASCSKSFRLIAKADEQYEAQLEQQPGECQVNIFRISRERDGSYIRRLATTAQPLKERCK